MTNFFRQLTRIKYSNLHIWWKELLQRKDFWKLIFNYRLVWGAFNIHSHQRRSDRKTNITYSTRKKADKAAMNMQVKYDIPFSAYKCLFCDGWHVGKQYTSSREAQSQEQFMPLPPKANNRKLVLNDLNIESIMQSNIPDLFLTYGGFRGRTLSSPRQASAWQPLVEGGISQIIDLRADYTSNNYVHTCREWGISYYHYPIAHDDESIRFIIENFSEFCYLIDKGRFYIACAMGLHRTDIALCLYWVFHGANLGKPLPELRGYTRQSGHTAQKIIRMLDHFYEAYYELKGYKPISEEQFIRRKQMIISSV